MEKHIKPQIKVPSVNDVMGKNTPDKKFRAGAIVSTIWTNQSVKDGKVFEYKTISFDRNYMDKDGKWQTTNSLRMQDLPKAVLVLSKAYEYLALNLEHEEEDTY